MDEPLEGIAAADALLGQPFPLPSIALPLCRWVDVTGVGDGGAEVAWNLDDTRPGSPGRVALYAGAEPPPAHELADAAEVGVHGGVRVRSAPLAEAQESLRPVTELTWETGGLHLRLTAQGPWPLEALLAMAASV
ncbi:MAG: hypothetical protein ABI950_00980 [Solirubrobacteraceae bacterium]